MSFTAFLDPILGPLMNSMPAPYNLLLISFILTGMITLAYKFFTDQKLMKEIKEEQKSLQKEMKAFKDHPDKFMELQKKALEKTITTFKESLKPTLITFLPIIIIFGWLKTYYTGLGNPTVLFGLGWIWVYIIFSIILSITLRKLLKIY